MFRASLLLAGLLAMGSAAFASAPTPITVTTNARAVSGTVGILKLCGGPITTFNCDSANVRIVSCKVPITLTGPNQTVNTSCKAPFTVYGFQFSMNVTSTDGTVASGGGGAVLVGGTYTVTVTGSTGAISLKVGK